MYRHILNLNRHDGAFALQHVQIRGHLISYADRKKREQNMEENRINTKIELLEGEEFTLDPTDVENIDKLKTLKK